MFTHWGEILYSIISSFLRFLYKNQSEVIISNINPKMFFKSLPLLSTHSFVINQKSDFSRYLSHLDSPFMEPFPERKQSLGESNQLGLFFMQWTLKINIPTSPLPLWERMVRSNRDILFITLESFTNSILSKQRFSSLRKFKLCICKKLIFLELPM